MVTGVSIDQIESSQQQVHTEITELGYSREIQSAAVVIRFSCGSTASIRTIRNPLGATHKFSEEFPLVVLS